MNEKTRQRNCFLVPSISNSSLPWYFIHELLRCLASLMGNGIFSPTLNLEASKLRALMKMLIMSYTQSLYADSFHLCSPVCSIRCCLSWQLPLGYEYHISAT